MSRYFPNVVKALHRLKVERPELQSEVDRAIQMIVGSRPNIEDKYDGLLIRLDRTYTRLEDVRDNIRQQLTSPLARVRQSAKTRVFCLNKILGELQWARARNADLIKLKQKHEQSGNTTDAASETEAGDLQEAAEARLQAEVSEQVD